MILQATSSLLHGFSDGAKILYLPTALRSRFCICRTPHPDLGTPCWLWNGEINRNGYGRVCIYGKRPVAHRAVFVELVGQIPDDMILDHQCRVRSCVNPWHMEVVTHRVNTLRGNAVLFQTILKDRRAA